MDPTPRLDDHAALARHGHTVARAGDDAARMSDVRWWVVTLLVALSIVSYIERMNISVAAKLMMPEFGLTQIQMGQIFSAFQLGYALLQAPLGLMSDTLGPYRALGAMGWSWAALTLLTGYVPGRFLGAGAGAFAVLLVIRFLLGVSISGVFPVSASAIGRWQPFSRRAFSYSFIIVGVSAGSAMTPPLVAWLMVTFGWRQSFYIGALLAAAVAILWTWYGADGPHKHPGVSPAELEYITGEREPELETKPLPKRAWLHGLRNRSLGCLTLSYFVEGHVFYVFVFWLFTYLVDVRKFSILGSGAFASLPFILGAIMSPIGGAICDWATARIGPYWGRRVTPITGALTAAVFLLIGVRTSNPYLAVVALSFCFGFEMLGQASVWSTGMDIGGRMTGMATGILNTANNIGGVVSTALMPVLVAHFGWVIALETCAITGLMEATLWLGVDPLDSIDPDDPHRMHRTSLVRA